MPRLASITPDDDVDDIPASIPQTQTKIEDDADEQLQQELADTTDQKQARKRKATSKPKEEKLKEPKPELEESVNGDANDEDEYEVEKIVGHIFKGKKCLYRVRWKGWSENDDTYEPEDHLLPDSKELLAAYHKTIGGTPQPTKRVAKSASKANLRDEAPATTEDDENINNDSSRPSKRAKRAHKSASDPLNPESLDWKNQPITDWKPTDKSSWEDLVHEVETVERDETGNLYAFIRFRNGKRSKVANNLYTSRCPRAMLRFYESHLNFN